MKLTQLTPNLMVEDVNRSLTFYQDNLGFETMMTVPENGTFDWAMMKRDSITLMFQTRASLTSEIPALKEQATGGALTLYIDIENIEGLHAKVKETLPLVQPLQTTFYGKREFSIQDCDGFILVFAEMAEA